MSIPVGYEEEAPGLVTRGFAASSFRTFALTPLPSVRQQAHCPQSAGLGRVYLLKPLVKVDRCGHQRRSPRQMPGAHDFKEDHHDVKPGWWRPSHYPVRVARRHSAYPMINFPPPNNFNYRVLLERGGFTLFLLLPTLPGFFHFPRRGFSFV